LALATAAVDAASATKFDLAAKTKLRGTRANARKRSPAFVRVNAMSHAKLQWHDNCLPRDGPTPSGRTLMLAWTVTFLIVAIVAALLGFAGIAGAAAGIAKIIFYLFLILFVISLVFGSLRPRPPH
jgi:uncharacterized membrane protein YtjA (UPF0391 family)